MNKFEAKPLEIESTIQMPAVQHFPSVFAVIRTQAIPRPCLQILQSQDHSHSRNYERSRTPVFIRNFPGADRLQDSDLYRLDLYQVDPTIFTLRYLVDGHRDVREVKFWTLPYYIRYHNEHIPVLEFQYRSWLPENYQPVAISRDIQEVLHVHARIESERIQEIRAQEDSGHRFSQYGEFTPSIRYSRHTAGPDDWDDRLYLSRNQLVGARGRSRTPSPPRRMSAAPPPPVVQIVEVPVERVIREVRTRPIPKTIGELILVGARNGSDSCPIAALSYKDCVKLSVSSCFHIFDKESLDRWMETSESCPVCRSRIENVISEEV